MRSVLRTVLAALVFAALAPQLWGQQANATGTIMGLVTDPSGAVIVGATATITDRTTQIKYTTVTNREGRYIFSNVKPSFYDVSFRMSGFRRLVVANQQLVVGTALTVNGAMEVGATTQTVEVQATPGAELQTMNSTMGTTLSGNIILQLPTFDRDVSTLLQYQATAVPSYNGHAGNITSGTVAGHQGDQNTYALDGGNATDDLAGDNGYVGAGHAAIPTPVESIQEFAVNTNNQMADFSSSSGGQVLLVTKRGTDQIHGSAYDFVQNSALDANDWSNNFTAQQKPFSVYNRFGFALGGPMLPKMAGGKTYFYFNYEGERFPRSQVFERNVPTDLMRQGILQFRDATGAVVQYNLKNSTQCGLNGGQLCDPRGLGINPDVSQIWNTYMPEPNDFNAGDRLNTFGFQAPLSLPLTTNFMVGRVDHDFGDKLRWFSSYRWYSSTAPTADQVDIGGLLPGDKKGVAQSVSSNLYNPRFLVTGLTASITPSVTNDFHFSYIRNDWQWIRGGFVPQLSGLPAPLELSGENYNAPIPINLDTQNGRARLWDGHDWDYRDTVSWLKGSHYFQFGGEGLHEWWHFTRYDDVVSGLTNLVYQVSNGTVVMTPPYQPQPCSATLTSGCLPASELGSWNADYGMSLGMVSRGTVVATRTGSNLQLNPLGTPVQQYVNDDFYALYMNDAWHIKPNLTLSYGLNWSVQTPPYDLNGVQDVLTDAAGNILTPENYLAYRQSSAINGQNYMPTIGFTPVRAVGTGLKYPYQTFYGAVEPRISIAWSPTSSGFLGSLLGNKATVIRGGYSRIYDRSNAINLTSTAVLGDGFLQPTGCSGPSIGGQCLGSGAVNPGTAFRIGTDGNSIPISLPATLAVPVTPGVNASYISGLAASLDYAYRPGYTDGVDFSIQRQLKGNVLVEVGYVGNWMHNLFQGMDMADVPWMMKQGGQTFANAYDNLYFALHGNKTVTPQPFFENALKGSAYCGGFSNCTAAVAANESGNILTQSVMSMWTDLENSWTFGPSLLSTTQCFWCYSDTSLGFGNYQALTASVQKRTGQGLTLSSNFTYGHALGTLGLNQEYTLDNVDNPWNLYTDYGPQYFDRKFILNIITNYELPFGNGKHFASGNGVINRIISGWSFAPIFTFGTGEPLDLYTGSFQEFGAGNDENGAAAVPLVNTRTLSNSAHLGTNQSGLVGSNTNAASGGPGVNMFGNNAAQVYSGFMPCLVGICGRAGGGGQLRTPSFWNLDFSLNKETQITERVRVQLFTEWFNGLNHMAWGGDLMSYSLQDPLNFGSLGQYNTLQGNYTRVVQLGLRLEF